MKTELKYGVITGLGVSLYVIAEYLLGFHTTKPEVGEYSGYFSSIIPVIAIFFAIKEKRNRSFEGIISYWQAFITGLIVAAISSFIITAFFFVYNNYINPEGLEYLSQWRAEQLRADNYTEEEIAASLDEFNVMRHPLIIFTGTFIMGLLITAVLAFFLKRKEIPAVRDEV